MYSYSLSKMIISVFFIIFVYEAILKWIRSQKGTLFLFQTATE